MYLRGRFISEGIGRPGERVRVLHMEKYSIQQGSIIRKSRERGEQRTDLPPKEDHCWRQE